MFICLFLFFSKKEQYTQTHTKRHVTWLLPVKVQMACVVPVLTKKQSCLFSLSYARKYLSSRVVPFYFLGFYFSVNHLASVCHVADSICTISAVDWVKKLQFENFGNTTEQWATVRSPAYPKQHSCS